MNHVTLTLRKALGKRLREFRLNNHIQSKELAKALKLSPSYYSQIESGQRSPSLETLANIHWHTGMNLHTLIVGKESVTPKTKTVVSL